MAERSVESSKGRVDLEQYQTAFNLGGVPAFVKLLSEKADKWKSTPLNIGVIGNSGVGKSTFINTIRGLTGDDPGSAQVGVVDTTKEPTPYSHPKNDQLKFWDFPGAGTPEHPAENYLEQVRFVDFDFFLLISKSRFTEIDLNIANAITRISKKFFFIRTQIDTDITNDQRAHPASHNTAALLTQIRVDIQINLITHNLYRDNIIFLIDSHNRDHHDFNSLEQRLIDCLPYMKKAAFVFSMTAHSESIVQKKVEILRQDIWKEALLAALDSAAQVPGLSFPINTKRIFDLIRFYFEQLGLDEATLEQRALATSPIIHELREGVKSMKELYLTTQGLASALGSGSALAARESVQEGDLGFYVFSQLISLTSGGASAYIANFVLEEILKKLEKTALKVVRASVANTANMIKEDDGGYLINF